MSSSKNWFIVAATCTFVLLLLSNPMMAVPKHYSNWDTAIHQGVVVEKNTESVLWIKTRYIAIKESDKTYVAKDVVDKAYYSVNEGENVFFLMKDDEVAFFTTSKEELNKVQAAVIEKNTEKGGL